MTQIQKEEPQMRKISNAWERNLESYRKGEKNSVIQTWASYNRKQYKIGKLEKNKLEKLMEINFSFDSGRKKKSKGKTDELSQEGKKPRKKRGETWNENFELYCKGEKSDLISTWMAYNRKQYKEGKLSEEKFKKLIKVNFPFDVVKNEKADGWDKQLEEWKKGDRKSIPMQQWRQRSIRHFLEGKLSGDRIVKLKEVGILK